MCVCEQFLSGSNKCNDDDDVGIRNSERGNRVAPYTGLGENLILRLLLGKAKAVVFTILHCGTYPSVLSAVMENVSNSKV